MEKRMHKYRLILEYLEDVKDEPASTKAMELIQDFLMYLESELLQPLTVVE